MLPIPGISHYETPEEKAKRLGVRLIPPAVTKPSKEKKDDGDEYKKNFEKFNKTVAICGGCGKEIKEFDKREPCGNNDCPFGHLSI